MGIDLNPSRGGGWRVVAGGDGRDRWLGDEEDEVGGGLGVVEGAAASGT